MRRVLVGVITTGLAWAGYARARAGRLTSPSHDGPLLLDMVDPRTQESVQAVSLLSLMPPFTMGLGLGSELGF